MSYIPLYKTEHCVSVFDQTFIMKMERQVKEPLPVVGAHSIPLLSGPADPRSVHSMSVSTKPVTKHQVISLNNSRELLRNKTGFASGRGLKLFKSNILKVQSLISLKPRAEVSDSLKMILQTGRGEEDPWE